MTLSDSVFKSDSGSSPEKKNSTTTSEKKDATTTGTGADNHLDQQNHDDHSSVSPQKLHEDTWWGASLWKSVKDTVQEGADYVKGAVAADQNVDDIEKLTFSTDIFKTSDTKKAPTVPDTPVANTSDISSWFSKMSDAASSIGKQVTGKVTDGLDWIFSETDKSGNKTDVSAKNGEAHVNGKNGDGVPVNVHVNQHEIQGQVGAAEVLLNKDTKTGDYVSKGYKVHVENGIKTIQNGDDVLQWDEKAQKGFIADKSGKHLYDFTSKDELTQQLTKDKTLTQTQGRADQTADQSRAKMNAGEAPLQTKIYADKDGNYAIVRQDGLMIKTYKSEPNEGERGYVTIEKDGHMIKIQDNHAFYQQEDPVTHAKQWVEMRGHRHHLPHGLQVDENTGAVAVDGKTVVAANGNVQADSTTNINMKTGKLTTGSDTGTVTVDNEHGRTHVRHPGCGDIVNDGHTFVNMDPKTRHIFSSMDSDTGEIRAFGGKNGSGITLDTKPGGNVTIREENGQVTQMNNQGYFNSVDAEGRSLMNVDTSGNVDFYDGTRVGADGTVSNAYGSANAWDGGQTGSAAITSADSAIGAALAASAQFDPTGSSLAALDAADSELNSLAATYTAMGRLDLVAQISNTLGDVGAARSRVLQLVAVSNETERRLGDGSASRVHEALASGSPENFIRNQEQQKHSEVA